mgnify:CR=1 FL=1
MEKLYNISALKFDNGQMIIYVNEKVLSFQLSEISDRLSCASTKELLDFKISPSGYGIHWKQLDEDISINGLIELHERKNSIT